jgi:NAD+ kinase
MKVLIFGKGAVEARELVEKSGFEIVESGPDIIVSYGGDGTLMRAEFEFPGVPKLVLKGSRICKLCAAMPNEEILERAARGKYRVEEMIKLEARAKDKTFFGLNDIVVHNADPRHAVRYEVSVDDVRNGGEIIGDGVVIATPLGSTGYYRSITDSFFETGIGLAFNNSTEQSDHMILKEGSEVRIKIARGPAIVYADNQPESVELVEGDEVVVKRAKETAKILRV